MTTITELWTDRTDFRNTRIVERPAAALEPGQLLLEIEKFGLTANNVSYALSGDMIGYWNYYPAEDPWGKVPVWGFGRVVATAHDRVPVGERVWGFFPMATHAVLTAGAVNEDRITDTAEHRRELPPLYNSYQRTARDPKFLAALEDERCLLFPSFATSFILYDYLKDADIFGAGQVLVGSASSKTGFAMAHMCFHDPDFRAKIVGLTSPANEAFVRSLGCYDEVVTYDRLGDIDAGVKVAFVDMSGNGTVRSAIHHHLRDNLVESCMVGATHWEEAAVNAAIEGDGGEAPLPGAQPAFFFAPAHMQKREEDWGRGTVMPRAFAASAKVAQAIKDILQIQHLKGPQIVQAAWVDLVDNKVPAQTGLMLSMGI